MEQHNLSIEAEFEQLLKEDILSVKDREKIAFDSLATPFEKSLVLFGAGNLGRKTLSGLRKIGIEPKAFCDNNSAIWNSFVDGLKVLSPSEAAQVYREKATFVITIWRALGGDRQSKRRYQLIKLNCQKVVTFGYLYWKYPDIFLPHYALDEPHKLYEHRDELKKVFNLWNDNASRREYLAQLRFRMLLDFDGLPSPVEHKQYFADDLYSFTNNDFFVDVGAFNGDTVQEFLKRQGSNFNQVIALEPDINNYKELESYIVTLPAQINEKVTSLCLAAGARKERIWFDAKGTVQSSVSKTGNIEIDCAPLDEILKGQAPTFLKMDIEGSEIDALLGCTDTIKKNIPILAICVYHRPDHIWKIPLLIHSLSEKYRFYLRPHDEEGWDLVCYAVPIKKLLSKMDRNAGDGTNTL